MHDHNECDERLIKTPAKQLRNRINKMHNFTLSVMCSQICVADKKSDTIQCEQKHQEPQPLFLRKRQLEEDDSSDTDDAMEIAEKHLPSSKSQKTLSEDVDAADFSPDFFPATATSSASASADTSPSTDVSTKWPRLRRLRLKQKPPE